MILAASLRVISSVRPYLYNGLALFILNSFHQLRLPSISAIIILVVSTIPIICVSLMKLLGFLLSSQHTQLVIFLFPSISAIILAFSAFSYVFSTLCDLDHSLHFPFNWEAPQDLHTHLLLCISFVVLQNLTLLNIALSKHLVINQLDSKYKFISRYNVSLRICLNILENIAAFLTLVAVLPIGLATRTELSFETEKGRRKIEERRPVDRWSRLSILDYTCTHIVVVILEVVFRRVPPDAIPPMIDCILVSTSASPSSFFSDLLKEFPNLTERYFSAGANYMRMFVTSLFLDVIFQYLTLMIFHYLYLVYKLKLEGFFMKIWKSCKLLFSMGSLERRDAYNVLSLYLSFSSPTDEPEDVTVGGREETFDLRADQEFWDEIKRGLLDKESLVRKQSLHILKMTLNLSNERKCYSCILEQVSDESGSNSHMMSKKMRWADKEAQSLGVGKKCNHHESSFTGWYRWEAFVFLYEMLEEYGTHLVEAAWNHQINLWLRSLLPSENSVISVNEELYHNRMATAEQTFEWLAILWERGFCHDNPQVRCLIMQSFLAVDWENYGGIVKLVAKDFLLGPLIRGLNDPVHHRGFGVKEVYSSWAIEAAARFLSQYASYMEGRQHISFLIDLSSIPKTHSFGRAGLMCLVECIASAACGVIKRNNHEIKQLFDATTDEIVDEFAPNIRADLLEVLRFVLECSKQHFNPKYRNQVCAKTLAAAASVMTGTDIPLKILLHFIASLPREHTDYDGSLRYVVQKWLRGPNLKLLKAIDGFPWNFISYQHPLDSLFTYDDEELEAWGSEARRWARVLFLVVEGREHFSPILKFIQDHGGDVCKQKNSLEWVPVKFLILISSLIEEFQVIQGRTAMYRVTRRIKRDLDFPSMVDNRSFTEESIVFDKFAAVLFSFLEELVSFTKLSCSVFWWGVVTEDMILPGSIKGKLGGPSQRRLPSSLCTSVLEAITAIKTLASLLRWCVQFRTDGLTSSAQSFLWNLCWKIITTPAPKSEVEGEICIAAYEACAYALKDLVSVFSPLSLDLAANNDNSFPSEADGKALLDVFVSTFIHNINNVIDGGNLARSRRAILMNWKWSCLESLLSIPNHALCNGVHPQMCKLYFSDTVVTQIFGDLVESLENAGEASALSMLRSVRLSMELFDSKRMWPSISSSDGMTIEMMWLLVHSSWILHISCNKRRVAPIAALLSSVLHYSVFGDERMHEVNNVPGPMKWFVEKILEEGTKSPRTIRLAALHLCGLWLAYPNTIKYYINELKLLTFYGSVAFDEDFEAELAENYDARTEVSVLSRSLDPELTDVFINTELYARVSVAVLFAKLADCLDKSTAGNEDNFAVIASGKMFLLELLNSVVNDKDLSKELYKKYSAIHRRKVRAWQMICALSRFVDLDIVEQVTSSLHSSIHRNNLPSVRQYLETFAIYIYLKFPSLVGQQLVSQLRNCDLRPQALSSYVFIAANVILHANKENGHLDELLPPIIPLLTTHHHTLRGFTQILVYQVLENLLPDSNSSSCASMSLERRCFVGLKHYLAYNSDCARLRASMDSYLNSFDPVKSVSPAGIFTDRIEELEFECVSTTLMDRVIDFLNDTREDLRCSMANDAAAIKSESIQIEGDPTLSEILNSNGGQSVIQLDKELLYDFQRKINFSNNEMQDSTSTVLLDKKISYGSLLDMEKEDQLLDQLLHSRGMVVEMLKESRQQIILLASLVDRIPNLAGLARTCEVFRAAGLGIADKNVLNDKQFQLIRYLLLNHLCFLSVTAEKWVPVVEVPVGTMKVFLEKKKQEGFAILGLEQTANSIPLDQYNFPTKTVLVLGREKEGIPVEIIHILDACIEIPQLGVVRSLNVHVSGAIALWEYTRQQRLVLNST
ncbi:hypothetical protein DH2020_020260 [Rehmannia glutinosa]|uniref:tRNA/rRNA methyltransferase SpoU type domain-containing protein n=1 Tax=Rehmannia glutinosa TaxID=99300 RepID=A0ABR0WFL4_REHGL